jgi:integrase
MGGTREGSVGIQVRGNSIRLRFSYRGKQRHETLKGKKVSKANIEFAKKKLAVIELEIADGSFDYANHFPDSKFAAQFKRKDADRTVAEGGTTYLARMKAKLAPSGYRTYAGKYKKHILPKWGQLRIKDVMKSDLEEWQLVTLPETLSEKTINLIFIVLRGIFDDAFSDQIIDSNPLDRITNLEVPDDQEPDPFTQDELDTLLTIETTKQQEINAIGFNARSGLRESELLGLAWEDLTVKREKGEERWIASIKRGRVANEYRIPKTKGSVREIDLQPEAVEYLKRQMPFTYALPPRPVEVRQRGGRNSITEELRFVFHSSATGKPWSGDTVFRKTYAKLLAKAGVRYRGPNQLRHTFCCWLLTNYIPPEWVAPIMGTSVSMIRKHYGKMIPGDRPSLGGVIKRMLADQRAKIEEKGRNLGQI